MDSDEHALSTRSIHAGEIHDPLGSPHTPLYDTTTFRFDSTESLLDVVEGRKPGYLYTRYGTNPTIERLQARLASLDGAEAALAFSSGMAALSALFLTHGRRGVIGIGDTYGGTLELLTRQLPELGIKADFLLGTDVGGLDELLGGGAGLVFFETPNNPTLGIVDIRRAAAIAHAHGALCAVDNTFATPVNQQPLALGADIVMHSATKYLGGHSDITGGVLCGARCLLEPIAPWRKNLGQMLAPETAHLLTRSLCTLSVRVERQNATALAIATMLAAHPRVLRVMYPGLPDFPGHALAAQQMSGFGGMLSFEIDGTGEDAARVVDRLRLITLAPSLGGVESLVTQPATTSHHDLSPEQRHQRGISDSLVRLSVGLEDSRDLIADLNQALA